MIYVYEHKWPTIDHLPLGFEDVCSRMVEIDQRISEDALKACPHCGYPVYRLIVNTNIATGGGTPRFHRGPNG